MSTWATVPIGKTENLDKFLNYRLSFPGGSGTLDLRGTHTDNSLNFESHLELSVLKGIKKIVSLSLFSEWKKFDGEHFVFSTLKEENRVSSKARLYEVDHSSRSVLVKKEGQFKDERRYKIPEILPIESLFDPVSFFMLGEIIDSTKTQKFGFYMNKKFFAFESVIEAGDSDENFKVRINQDFGDRIPKAFLPELEIENHSIKNFEVNLKIGKLKVVRV